MPGESRFGETRGMSGLHELGKARHDGVWAGCMGSYTLGRYVPRRNLGHLDRRTVGRGSYDGEGLLRSQIILCQALVERH